MSVALGCPVSTLTGPTQSTGLVGPAGSDPGVGPASHVGGRRQSWLRRAQCGGALPDFAGKSLWGTGRGASRRVRTSARRRVDWGRWRHWSWLESAPASRPAAERLQSKEETARQCAIEQKRRLGRIYVVRRVQWARARDQTVTRDALATSSATMRSASS